MSVLRTDQDYLLAAIQIATANVHHAGGPFGAVIVSPDGRIFEGANRVTATNDPSAHAEVVAIRAAAAALETFDLTGCVLYASCEPCPMCLATSLWARIERVYFAADRNDAAKAGFDDALFYQYFEPGSDQSLMPVSNVLPGDGAQLSPFEAWTALASRTDY